MSPPRLVLGLGARGGLPAAELRAAVVTALAEAGLTTADVTVLATIDRRAGEDGVRTLARDLRWEVVAVAAAGLAGQAVPHPSARVALGVGTGSVAEAAALLIAGPGATLVLPKRILAGVTVAIARSATPT
ncbi:cobalamin biosynthesis protein [Micromonosporaceae bacterium Da 78-11]